MVTLTPLIDNKLITSRFARLMDVDGLTCARETSVGLGTRILPAEGTAILLTGDQESTWSLLLKNLRAGDCLPFLGAGACHERIPLGEQMALNWGEMEGYPLADTTNLPRVMQYIATARYNGDAITLKHDFVRREISGVAAPDFSDSGQIHGVLARLDLPLYVTTNYDDFMFLALQHWRKLPRFDYSPWYVTGEGDTHDSPLTDRAYQATPRTPLVYHLHGHYERPQSLVLTEDDYIEYLVQLASDTHHHAGTTSGVLPPFVRGELRSKPLLFIGYSLRDWTFLVLFRTLLHGISDVHRRNHVSVQVDPGERVPREARDYLEQYLKAQRVQIFWASASDFAHELSSRLGGTTS